MQTKTMIAVLATICLVTTTITANATVTRILPRDGSVEGRLSAGQSDGEIHHRSLMHHYQFDAEVGESWEFHLGSSDFDAYLYLLDAQGSVLAYDDDGGGQLNSLLRHVFQTAGTYRLAVTSFGGSAEGAYQLRAAQMEVRPVNYTSIRLGELQTGRFDDGAGRLPSGEYVIGYTLEISQPMQAQVTFSGLQWSSSARLLGPFLDEIVPDQGFMSDGVSSVTLLWPGSYRLLVSSPSPMPNQTFTLRIDPFTAASVADTRALVFGQPNTARLVPGARWQGDRWSFEAQAGDQLVATMRSTDFDAYLILKDPWGTIIAEDDDGGGNLDSRIAMRIQMSGTYELIATSFSDDSQGQYTLTANLSTPGAFEPRRINLGQAVEANLSNPDFFDQMNGSPTHLYTFQGTSNQRVRIRLEPAGLNWDLRDPTGQSMIQAYPFEPWMDDYHGHRFDEDQGYYDDIPMDSQIWDPLTGMPPQRELVDLTYTGAYSLLVYSIAQEPGPYTMRVDAIAREPLTPTELQLGSLFECAFSESSPLDQLGNFMLRAHFEVPQPARVVIRAIGAGPAVQLNVSRAGGAGFISNPSPQPMQPNEIGRFSGVLLPGQYLLWVSQHSSQPSTFIIQSETLPASAPQLQTISLGQVVSSSIENALLLSPFRATPAIPFVLHLQEGQNIRLTMRSTDFDSYLVVVDGEGNLVNTDDDSAGNLDAQLDLLSPHSSEYRIFATSYGDDASGSFTLRVDSL